MSPLQASLCIVVVIATLPAQDDALPIAGPATCGAAGDLDADGDLDLVIGREDQPLALLLNDGRGTFTIAANAFSLAEGKVTALAVFDADGDGDLDVLVGGWERLTRLWLNNGKLNFVDGSARLPQPKPWASEIVVGDLDGDGDLDVVSAIRAYDSVVFRNEGPRFVLADDALPRDLRGATSLALADLDGDKDLDLVCGQRPDPTGKGGGNRALRNDGKGKFTDHTEAWMPSATAHTMGVALADLDGNGALDLVCANRGAKPGEAARSAVHRRGDDGKFANSVPRRYSGKPAISNVVALGDIDGDQDVDLVFGNDGPTTLHLNDGQGVFSASERLPRFADDTRSLLLVDLDGDRDLDVVTVNYAAPSRRFLNSGTGEFGTTPAAAPTSAGEANGDKESTPRITPFAAGKYASRAKARATVAEPAPRAAINAALRFLADHQADDGAFRAATFVGGEFGDASVAATHDVGVTALGLLCFLAEGSHPGSGFHSEAVHDGVRWLISQQQKTGSMGPDDGQHGIYDHAVATLALGEAFAMSGDATLRAPLERALAEIERRRNPDGGFRYEPGVSPSDASVTVWCTLALCAGNDGGLAPAAGTTARTLAFLRGLTDSVTGRTGYMDKGGLSSRMKGEHETRYPAEKSEGMTGAALFARLQLGDNPAKHDDMRAGLARVAAAVPKVEPDGYFDPHAWFHIAQALSQLGDPEWATWRTALHEVLVGKQRKTGKLLGSWDPDEPWGSFGGRFASTALATLSMQAGYRFASLVDPKWRRNPK